MSDTEMPSNTTETPEPETPSVKKPNRFVHAITWLIHSFLHLLRLGVHGAWWLIKRALGVRRNNQGEDEVVIFSYPSLVLSWPLLFLGFFFWAVQDASWFNPEIAGWIWLATFGVIILALGADIGIAYLAVILLVLALLTVSIKYANNLLGWVIFIQIGESLSNLAPKFSPDLGLAISLYLSVLYVIMIANAKINNRLEMDNNVFSEVKLLRKTVSFPRAGRSVNWEFPDFFAMILGIGAGNLEITYQGRCHYITNVPFLLFRLFWIKRILEAVQTTSDHITAEMGQTDPHHEDTVAAEHPIG